MDLREKQIDSQANSDVTGNSIEILRKMHSEIVKSVLNLLIKELTSINPQPSKTSGELGKAKISLYREVRRFEEVIIRCALILTGGVQYKAAELLGIKFSTLNVKIRRYKINVKIKNDHEK